MGRGRVRWNGSNNGVLTRDGDRKKVGLGRRNGEVEVVHRVGDWPGLKLKVPILFCFVFPWFFFE